MLNKFLGLFVLFFIVFLTSCNYLKDSEQIVAEVDGEELSLEKIRSVFNEELSIKDPRVKQYVNQWIRDRVVLNNAEKLLSPSEKDFSEQMEQYRNSLLRYTLEAKYVQEELDTTVNDQQITEYYKKNSSNFELKENIVKARVLKLPVKFKERNLIKSSIQFNDSLGRIKFLSWVKKKKLEYFSFDTAWLSMENLKLLVPIYVGNEQQLLNEKKYLEFQEGEQIWCVYFVDFLLKDNVSPLEAVKDKIKNIIINKRKVELIREKEKQLFRKAIKKGQIKLYLEPV